MLKIPIIGNTFKIYLFVIFLRVLWMCYKAGLPLTNALQSTAKCLPNVYYRQGVEYISQQITTGKSFSDSLTQSKLFSARIEQLIMIGEQAGSLEQMLAELADYYQSELERKLIVMSQLLEPLIMIILCVMVGGLVIAMYMPIFRLGAVIG